MRCRRQITDLRRSILIADVERQLGRTLISIGISQAVGKGVRRRSSSPQSNEIRIRCIERVGVAAICIDHDRAIGADEARTNNGSTICAQDVVADHIPAQRDIRLTGRTSIAINNRRRHIINNIDTQAAGAVISISVRERYRQIFKQ